MQTYIAILRGINVSGKNKIAMKELKAAFDGVGYQNVATYIQSGNVVFGHKQTAEKILAQQITQLIKTAFGLEMFLYWCAQLIMYKKRMMKTPS